MNAKKSSHRPNRSHFTVTTSRGCPPNQPIGKYPAMPIEDEVQEQPQPEWRFPKRRTSVEARSLEQPMIQF